MTAVVLPHTAEPLPESQNVELLRRALDDPALIGFREEILAAIEQLTGGREEE